MSNVTRFWKVTWNGIVKTESRYFETLAKAQAEVTRLLHVTYKTDPTISYVGHNVRNIRS